VENKILEPNSGIIIQCPQVETVKIILKSKNALDVYYADKSNIENLQKTGNFKNDSGVIYKKNGKDIEEFIRTMSGESYFVIINPTNSNVEFSFEIKNATYSPVGASYTNVSSDSTGMTGYGTSGYKYK
jgi:hypothetical protein